MPRLFKIHRLLLGTTPLSRHFHCGVGGSIRARNLPIQTQRKSHFRPFAVFVVTSTVIAVGAAGYTIKLNRSSVLDRKEDPTATEPRTVSSSSRVAAQQSGSQCVDPIGPKTVTNILRRFETSSSISTNSTPIRYNSVQVPCNIPMEDDHAEAIFPAPYGFGNGEWLFCGIYDGHKSAYTWRSIIETDLIK